MLDKVEQAIVDTVRDFVDREVRPVARELEHDNAYPEALIEQMKRLGVFGLAIPDDYGGAAVSTPISFSDWAAASTTRRMTCSSIWPMQPMRKESTTVSLPG